MNAKDYDTLSVRLATYADEIQTRKRPGYTRGDVDILKNFKDVASRSGLTPGQAWSVYFLKHIDAITSIMTKPGLPVSEAPVGRFADALNYLYLGYALYTETSGETARVSVEFNGEAQPRVPYDLGDGGDEVVGSFKV